jgi:hypothetical protein
MRAIRSCNGIAEQPSSSIAGVSNPATSASEPGSERRAKAPWQNHNGVWIRCSYHASGFPWPQYTTGVDVDDVVDSGMPAKQWSYVTPHGGRDVSVDRQG